MFASHIGKQLLRVYNERNGKTLTARQFFEEEYFPLFYNHPRYLQWITNSPFVQGYRAANPPDAEMRRSNLLTLHSKVETLSGDASFAIGFPAADLTATTSCQVSNLQIPLEGEDIYCSWIGSGLGIGVKGGYVLFVDDDEILWNLYQGWEHYRDLLEQTPKLKSNQIDTWNGHWLWHVFSQSYDSSLPMANLHIIEPQKDGTSLIPTIGWVQLIFSLMKKYPLQEKTAYVFSLGQTNKTLGFIQLRLKEVRRVYDVYYDLFGKYESLAATQMEDIYETAFGFETACEQGAIGLQAIEPKQLRDFMPSHREYKQPKFKNDDTITIKFNIYISWLIAMLNNKNLLEVAEKVAEALHKYESISDRAKRIRPTNVINALKATNKRLFFEGLTTILEDDPEQKILFNEIVDMVHSTPTDNFSYFLTLIKFKYTYLKQ